MTPLGRSSLQVGFTFVLKTPNSVDLAHRESGLLTFTFIVCEYSSLSNVRCRFNTFVEVIFVEIVDFDRVTYESINSLMLQHVEPDHCQLFATMTRQHFNGQK